MAARNNPIAMWRAVEEDLMMPKLRVLLVCFVAAAILVPSCKKKSHSKSRPPPSEGAGVYINGGGVTFANVDHYYDAVSSEIVIDMWNSSPAGWDIIINVQAPDANPGCVDTCIDWVTVEVVDPFGEIYWEDFCFYDVVECFSSYSLTPGTFTFGTFSGQVENFFVPGDVLNLTSGSFTAVRQ